MKIYIAARFSKRHIAHRLGKTLATLGHTIVSRWSMPHADYVAPVGLSEQATDDERRQFALDDMHDLRRANCLILLGESARNNSRGGRLVEFGVALAYGHRVMITQERETVFQCLPQVEFYQNEALLIAELQAEQQQACMEVNGRLQDVWNEGEVSA